MSNTEPLRSLAREVLRVHDWSTYTLADRVAGTPYARSKSWFANLISERERPTLLKPDDIEALALALNKPARVIREADLAGHRLMEADSAQQAWLRLADVAALTDRQRAAVLAVVEAMKEEPADATMMSDDEQVQNTDAIAVERLAAAEQARSVAAGSTETTATADNCQTPRLR